MGVARRCMGHTATVPAPPSPSPAHALQFFFSASKHARHVRQRTLSGAHKSGGGGTPKETWLVQAATRVHVWHSPKVRSKIFISCTHHNTHGTPTRRYITMPTHLTQPNAHPLPTAAAARANGTPSADNDTHAECSHHKSPMQTPNTANQPPAACLQAASSLPPWLGPWGRPTPSTPVCKSGRAQRVCQV